MRNQACVMASRIGEPVDEFVPLREVRYFATGHALLNNAVDLGFIAPTLAPDAPRGLRGIPSRRALGIDADDLLVRDATSLLRVLRFRSLKSIRAAYPDFDLQFVNKGLLLHVDHARARDRRLGWIYVPVRFRGEDVLERLTLSERGFDPWKHWRPAVTV